MKPDTAEKLRQRVIQIISGSGTLDEKIRRINFVFDRTPDTAELSSIEELTAELQPIGTPGSRVEWDHMIIYDSADTEVSPVEFVDLGKQTGTVVGYARVPVFGRWIALIKCDSEEVGFLEKDVDLLTFL